MVEAGVIAVNKPTIVELDGDDLAKAAYLKAVIGLNGEVKLPDDIDPIIHSIEVVGARYGNLEFSMASARIVGDIISELHKQSTGIAQDPEFISAIDILANNTITAKYASTLKKYRVSKQMLEVIRNAYNIYHVNQASFL